jgi:hypothetical protein
LDEKTTLIDVVVKIFDKPKSEEKVGGFDTNYFYFQYFEVMVQLVAKIV